MLTCLDRMTDQPRRHRVDPAADRDRAPLPHPALERRVLRDPSQRQRRRYARSSASRVAAGGIPRLVDDRPYEAQIRGLVDEVPVAPQQQRLLRRRLSSSGSEPARPRRSRAASPGWIRDERSLVVVQHLPEPHRQSAARRCASARASPPTGCRDEAPPAPPPASTARPFGGRLQDCPLWGVRPRRWRARLPVLERARRGRPPPWRRTGRRRSARLPRRVGCPPRPRPRREPANRSGAARESATVVGDVLGEMGRRPRARARRRIGADPACPRRVCVSIRAVASLGRASLAGSPRATPVR